MMTSTLIQIVAACAGVIGSLFFTIGVMQQTVSTMDDLSGTYVGQNPFMVHALASQKAEYLFGGVIIVVAFILQLISFLVPPSAAIPFSRPAVVLLAMVLTIMLFFILFYVSQRLAKHFEAKITAYQQQGDGGSN